MTVGPGLQDLPTGITTDFNVAASGSFPTCEHQVCIACGNKDAVCTAVKSGCDAAALNPPTQPHCVQSTCCDTPGFHLPALKIVLGIFNVCTRLDQIDCGIGVVNTSNPQSGHNEVKKSGDSLDPGPDCLYASSIDCTGNTVTNPGDTDDGGCFADNFGKVRTCRGADVNPNPDAEGVHVRLQTPGFATAWLIANDETCPSEGAVFDGKHCNNTHTSCTVASDCGACSGSSCVCGNGTNNGTVCTSSAVCTGGGTCFNKCQPAETLFSSLYQVAEPTTAGATGEFTELEPGDACGLSPGSQGFTPSSPTGPIVVKGDAPKPHTHGVDPGTPAGEGRTVAAGEAFSPTSPLFDIGFVTVTEVQMTRLGTADACSCTPVPICAEQ